MRIWLRGFVCGFVEAECGWCEEVTAKMGFFGRGGSRTIQLLNRMVCVYSVFCRQLSFHVEKSKWRARFDVLEEDGIQCMSSQNFRSNTSHVRSCFRSKASHYSPTVRGVRMGDERSGGNSATKFLQ